MRYVSVLLLVVFTCGCQSPVEPGPFDEGAHLLSGGPPPDGIPALNNPPRVAAVDLPVGALGPDEHVLGVYRNSSAMAYPVKVLDWHEVVNDLVGGEAVVVSYCPLTATGIGFSSAMSAGAARFGVSGLLCDSNLVMFDRITQSLWPQMTWKAVRGPLSGEQLSWIPVLETTWQTWKQLHPDTGVLNMPFMESVSAYDYDLYPYGTYYTSSSVRFPLRTYDSRLPTKARVHGVRRGGESRAFPMADLAGVTAVNDILGGEGIVVFGGMGIDFAVSFMRDVNGTERTFTAQSSTPPTMTDEETGSVWDLHGTAISGPDAGAQLTPAGGFTGFWFAWASFDSGMDIWLPPASVAPPAGR